MMVKNQRGVLLLEVLIALLLLNVVLAVGYLAYSFFWQSYNTAEARWKVQQETQIAANYITSEVRNALDIEILPGIPEGFTAGSDYIYLEEQAPGSGRYMIVHLSGAGVLHNVTGYIIDELSFYLNEIILDENNVSYTLDFQVKSNVQGAPGYELNSAVYLNNSSDIKDNINGRSLNPGVIPVPRHMAIRFVKP